MIALASLFIILIVSIVVVRIGTVALELTGIPQEIAAFQAQSAFSGTGFTTTEAEVIVNHPARRKIIRILIMLGSAGLTSSIATLIVAFVGQSERELAQRGIVLIIGLVTLLLLARSRLIYRAMKHVIVKMLRQHASLGFVDFNEMLGLGKGYAISSFPVKKNSWLVDEPIGSLNLQDEGVIILTIKRRSGNREELIGAPTAEVVLRPGDELVCYGKSDLLRNLAERIKGHRGNQEHEQNVDLERAVARSEESALSALPEEDPSEEAEEASSEC